MISYQKVGEDFAENFPVTASRLLPRRITPPATNYGPMAILAAFGGSVLQKGLSRREEVERPKTDGGAYMLKLLGHLLNQNIHAGNYLAYGGIAPVESRMIAVWQLLEGHQTPIFFPSPDLCAALLQTKVPDDMTLAEMKWPYSAMCFLLPRGLIQTPEDGDAVLLTVGLMPTNEVGTKTFIAGGCSERGIIWSIAKKLTAASPISELVDVPTDNELEGAKKWVSDLPRFLFGADDRSFTDRMVSLAINLIVCMTERAELVTGGGLLRPAKLRPGGRSRDALWAPIIIGEKYRITRDVRVADASAISGGMGVRIHWRRGHWRRHAHGPALSLRKTIWVEPVLVGG